MLAWGAAMMPQVIVRPLSVTMAAAVITCGGVQEKEWMARVLSLFASLLC
jgi:hypothetical protein